MVIQSPVLIFALSLVFMLYPPGGILQLLLEYCFLVFQNTQRWRPFRVPRTDGAQVDSHPRPRHRLPIVGVPATGPGREHGSLPRPPLHVHLATARAVAQDVVVDGFKAWP